MALFMTWMEEGFFPSLLIQRPGWLSRPHHVLREMAPLLRPIQICPHPPPPTSSFFGLKIHPNDEGLLSNQNHFFFLLLESFLPFDTITYFSLTPDGVACRPSN